MKTITVGQAKENLKFLGLINLTSNKPISFAGFKKRADVHEYGRGRNPLRIIYVGQPRQNLFGFYPMRDTKANNLKDAYHMYLELVNMSSDSDDYPLSLIDDIQWGNCGIPISYGDLRVSEPINVDNLSE